MNTSRKRRRRDANIRSAAAAARRSVTIGGGGVSKMLAAAERRRTALTQSVLCIIKSGFYIVVSLFTFHCLLLSVTKWKCVWCELFSRGSHSMGRSTTVQEQVRIEPRPPDNKSNAAETITYIRHRQHIMQVARVLWLCWPYIHGAAKSTQ